MIFAGSFMTVLNSNPCQFSLEMGIECNSIDISGVSIQHIADVRARALYFAKVGNTYFPSYTTLDAILNVHT